jgi:hypothetical protein
MSGMGTAAAPRYDLPRALYPFTLEALHPDTGAVVWSTTVHAPRGVAAIYIPPLKDQLGHEVMMRATFGDGTVIGPRRHEADQAAGEG